jgi:dTDP-4-amino-4,6-dideoxygalactose transaminase
MIPISRPAMGEPEAQAARRAILSGWTTQGPEVQAFEEAFARAVGAPYACAVSSCTTALHLALLVVGVRPGDEVIVPSHSFIATANAVRYCGATPVFIDIEPHSWNLDPVLVERAVTPRTRAMIAVHQMGLPCDLRRLVAVARRFELPIVEDAACAAGSQILWNGQWQTIGRPHGDIACFSFHPRKVISTGDGGMLTTARDDWMRQLRRLRQHGMSVSDATRHGAKEVVFEHYPTVGFNYRMTDIQAAVGREQLERLPGLVQERRLLAQRYDTLLQQVPRLGRPQEPPWARSNWQSYCVRLPAGVAQRQVMQAMLDAGVATRRGIMCSHREAAYASQPLPHPLPHSEAAQDGCVLLPLYAGMTTDEQAHVVASLGQACTR